MTGSSGGRPGPSPRTWSPIRSAGWPTGSEHGGSERGAEPARVAGGNVVTRWGQGGGRRCSALVSEAPAAQARGHDVVEDHYEVARLHDAAFGSGSTGRIPSLRRGGAWDARRPSRRVGQATAAQAARSPGAGPATSTGTTRSMPLNDRMVAKCGSPSGSVGHPRPGRGGLWPPRSRRHRAMRLSVERKP